jgi:hypothetical protein
VRNNIQKVAVAAMLFLGMRSAWAQAPAAVPPPGEVNGVLAMIAQTSHTTMSDLARIRIDRWKMDGDARQEAMGNAESIRRNLSAALPAIVDQARTSPNSLDANFKLYRTLSALYDVMAPLAATGVSAGSRDDGESLVHDAQDFDRARRALGDRLAQLAAYADAELNRARQAAAAAAAAPPPPPRKIVVDDAEPAPRKKPVKKPAATKPPAAAQPASKP